MKKQNDVAVKIGEKNYTFTVVLEPDLEAGGYTVVVPALPGCFTEGETVEEAIENAHDAISCHLLGLLKDGEKIPSPQENTGVVTNVIINTAELLKYQNAQVACS